MREIEISEEPIEFYKILKFENMVASGGEAKQVISEDQVMVNGKVCNSCEITVFNRGIALLLSDDERIRRIHRVLCKLQDSAND